MVPLHAPFVTVKVISAEPGWFTFAALRVATGPVPEVLPENKLVGVTDQENVLPGEKFSIS